MVTNILIRRLATLVSGLSFCMLGACSGTGDATESQAGAESIGNASSALSSSALLLPLKADDLPYGQMYSTGVHASGGIQKYAKDIGAMRYLGDGNWSTFTESYDTAKAKDPNTVAKNSDYLIYGKNFYAMASGTVVGCWRNANENTPGRYHADFNNRLMAGGGNHLWILQDDGNYALYAHAQKGSIPASICPNSAERFSSATKGSDGASPDIDPNVVVPVSKRVRVSKGQFLGISGNSGSSGTIPHLHVHLERGGQSVQMMLERGLYLKPVNGRAEINVKWLTMKNATWPEATIIFWPHHTTTWTNVTWNGILAADFQRYFDHWADSGYMADTVGCRRGSSSMLYDTTWVRASGSWLAYAGLSPASYDEKKASALADGYRETAVYTCSDFNGNPLKCTVLRK